jgi:DNA mismatch repair ATPase MutS
MQVVFLNKDQKPIDLEILCDVNEAKNYENRLKQWKSLDLSNKLVYLYKMKPGFALNSFAIFLANDLLNEDWIIKRAFQIQTSLLNVEKIETLPEIDQRFLEKTKTIIAQIHE